MIRVMIFLDKNGLTPIDKWECLGHMEISNNVARTQDTEGKRGDYSVDLFKQSGKKPWMKLKITNWPRQAYHSWELVRCILNQAAIEKGGRI